MDVFELNSKVDSAIESIPGDAVIDHRVFKTLASQLKRILGNECNTNEEKESAEKDLVEAIEHVKELGRKIQSQNKTIQIFKESIFKEPMALVTIQAAGGERIQVLKQLLIQKSHYFDAMLSNTMIEGESKLICFNDVGIQALEAVLWFLITATLPCSFIQLDASEQVASMRFACRIGLEKMLESVELAFLHSDDMLEKNPELCLRIIAEGRIYIPSHDPTAVWLKLRKECIEHLQYKLFRFRNFPNFVLPECVFFFCELGIVDLLDILCDRGNIIDTDGRSNDLWLTESDLRMLDPTQTASTDQSHDLYTSKFITVGMQSRKNELVQARLKMRRVEEKLEFEIFLDRTEHQEKIQNGTMNPDALDEYEMNWAILMSFEINIFGVDDFDCIEKSLGESSESFLGYYLSFFSDLPLQALSHPCIHISSFIHSEQQFIDICRQWLLLKEGQAPKSCFALWSCLCKKLDECSLNPQEQNTYREIINTNMAIYISASFTIFENIENHYKDIHLLEPQMMALLLESDSLVVSLEIFALKAVFSWAELVLDETGQNKLLEDFSSGLTFHAITLAEPSEWNSEWIAGTIVAIHGSGGHGRVEIRLKDSSIIERPMTQVEIYQDITLLLPLVRFPFISLNEEYEYHIESKHSLLKYLSVGQALLWEAFTIQNEGPCSVRHPAEDHRIRHIQDHPMIAPIFRDAQHRLQLNKKRLRTRREYWWEVPSLSEEGREHYRSMCF